MGEGGGGGGGAYSNSNVTERDIMPAIKPVTYFIHYKTVIDVFN